VGGAVQRRIGMLSDITRCGRDTIQFFEVFGRLFASFSVVCV
jgi:hypothetical protein